MNADVTNPRIVTRFEVKKNNTHPLRKWQRIIASVAKLQKDNVVTFDLTDPASYDRVRNGLYHAAKAAGVGITIVRESAKTIAIGPRALVERANCFSCGKPGIIGQKGYQIVERAREENGRTVTRKVAWCGRC